MRRFLYLIALLLPLAASAQQISGGTAPFQRLYATGVSVGNGADLTEDVLQTSTTIPAGILANVGDTIHIVAGGTFGATTDSKTVRIRVDGATVLVSPFGTTAGTNRWYAEVSLIKTGSNTQSMVALGANTVATPGTDAKTTVLTDTATHVLTVTGQNTTSSVAGSITCQLFLVDFIRGS